jgi:hypothetical protein
MYATIAGKEFRATVTGRVLLKNTVQENRVESGFLVADHIKPEPVELHLEIYANEEELAFIKELRNSKQIFDVDLADERGIYENVVVESLEVEREYENNYTVTITLKQIQTVELRTELIILEDIPLTEDVPGGTVAGTQEKEISDSLEKQENKSWLDSILSWFGGG